MDSTTRRPLKTALQHPPAANPISTARTIAIITCITCITAIGNFLTGSLTVFIPVIANDLHILQQL